MQPKPLPIEEILSDAIDLADPDARRQFVEVACGGDSALRHKVERLIENHFRAGCFLQTPAIVTAADATTAIIEGLHAVIGPYKLLEQIGEGGFGIVFMAEQQQPVRRKVALKVLKPGMDTRQVVARFEAERQALALMDHPNIAKILDGGETATGRPYFVMDLVRGLPITEYCDQNKLTPRERLELFLPVCQAVQHAHQKGIIHRDIKPSNVLISRHDATPVVKVIDFGIAKAMGQRLTDKTLFTNFAQLLGTPLYMSPEQAGMSDLDVDTRSDIYSLGVLLYELLTGTTPFDSERLKKACYDEMRRIIREEEPPRPSTRISTLGQAAATASTQRKSDPRRLSQTLRREPDWIVMKCLEKNRNCRYESASALAADVQRYLTGEPVQACAMSASYRLRKFARRNKVALATTSAIALALLLGTAVSTWQAVDATHARDRADQAAQRERTMADETREKQRHTATLLAAHQLDVGLKRLNDGNSEGLFDLLDARETADDLPELREPIARLWAVAHYQGEGRLTHVLPWGRNVAFSPDGKLLAILGDDVHLIDPLTGQSRVPSLKVPKDSSEILFSPDSRLLATLSLKFGAQLWDTRTGSPVNGRLEHPSSAAFPPGARVNILAFSPDGKLVAIGGADGTVRLWEASTGRLHAGPFRHGPQVLCLVFSPDGKWLASGSTGGTARLWDVVAKRGAQGPEMQTRGHVLKILFTSDGRRIITVSTNGGVTVWETETGRLVHQIIGGWVTSASLSPSSTILASGTADGQLFLWNIHTGELLQGPFRFAGRVESVEFSPSGRLLAVKSSDQVTTVYELGDRSRLSVLSTDRGGSWGGRLAWSPDGRYLATAGTVKLWRPEPRVLSTIPLRSPPGVALDPQGKKAALVMPGHVLILDPATGGQKLLPVSVTCLAFNPDGEALATGRADWTIEIWGKNGYHRQIHTSDQPHGLAWSPDGTRIMAATPMIGLLTEFDHATGKAIGQPFRHGDWVRAACYSPDGKLIATLGGDQSASVVRLWSMPLGAKHPPLILTATLPGGLIPNTASIAFSRHGQLLIVQPPSGRPVLLRVPRPPPDLHQIRLRTWLALGARRDSNGAIQAISEKEWSRLREEESTLERNNEPIRWEALEASFTAELLGRRQRIEQIVSNKEPLVPIFKKMVEQNRAKYGLDNDVTFIAMLNLASVYADLAQFDKEEPLLRTLLQNCKKQGAESPATAGALAMLGQNLIHQQKFAEAESILRECLAMREKLQPNDWTTFSTKSMLGGALLGQKKYAEAKPLLVDGYDGMSLRETLVRAQGKPRVMYEALAKLVRLYEGLGQSAKATAWQQKLDAERQAMNGTANFQQKSSWLNGE